MSSNEELKVRFQFLIDFTFGIIAQSSQVVTMHEFNVLNFLSGNFSADDGPQNGFLPIGASYLWYHTIDDLES